MSELIITHHMDKEHARRVLKVIKDLAEEIDSDVEEIIDSLFESNIIKYKAHVVLYNLLEEEEE
jgi:vesicle coat complex subunit